ncbi:MAG: hypothetical protein SFV51_23175 [Bryobacteraceae bacterium]|nr:hypothetical protein [Bryobacteraceae bacterium]
MPLSLFAAVSAGVLAFGAEHRVRPGDDPQAAADRAAPGDRLVFLPGKHVHPLRRHQSLLYVDKPLDIELMAGSTLKLADRHTVLLPDPEITTDHGAPKTIDDFSAGGNYDLALGPTIFTIQIDSVGKDGAPDTFQWGSGAAFDVKHRKVPVTGQWQTLSNGVQVRFDHTSGHSLNSLWFITYDGREAYGIRVGHGLQKEYVDGVRISGKGVIDLNIQNNVQPGFLVKNINACVLVHGRVRNVEIEGITMINTNRSVMLYGEHTGRFLQGGGTGPGESFDAENISITSTRTINPLGSGYLLGHPSHRGRLSKVRCNFNYMETATTSIEPNFNLDQYEVIGNVIKSGGRAIHCWRRSTNGLVAGNVRIDDSTGKEVVMVNAPGAWQPPENITLRDNRNHLSDPVGFWANVSGGMDNRATGRFAAVTGGHRNRAEADYSRAQGLEARALRAGEDVIGAGSFAQSGVLTARAATTGGQPAVLRLVGEAPLAVAENSAVAYRMLVIGRSETGAEQAAFEATGIAQRTGAGPVIISGAKVNVIHRSDAAMNLEITATATALDPMVRGAAMRWAARIELAELRF